MKKSILLLAALFFSTFLSAQMGFGKIKDLESLQKRQLIVMMEEPLNDPFSQRHQKKNPESWAAYEQSLEGYNARLKGLAEQHWKFPNRGIIYKTKSQIKNLSKSKSADRYAVLYSAHLRPAGFSSGIAAYKGLTFASDHYNKERNHKVLYTELRIALLEDFKKNSPIYFVPLANILPERSDLVFGINLMNMYLQMRKDKPKLKLKEVMAQMKTNKPRLKDKILLLREDWLAEDFDTSQIAKLYPYGSQIVSADVFNETIAQADNKYAYVMIIPNVSNRKGPGQLASSKSVFYLHFLVDAADGTVLDMVMPFDDSGVKILGLQLSKNTGKYFDAGIQSYAE